ncbi:MAG: hypothetical protein R3B84_20615 [Zavarzinella sp.]
MRSILCPLLAFLIVGCAPEENTSVEVPRNSEHRSPVEQPLPKPTFRIHDEANYITITPLAQEKMVAFAQASSDQKWWLRVSINWGGCTGFRTALDLDTAIPCSDDVVSYSGQIACVSKADMTIWIQGMLIDWEKTAFRITYPYQTEETRKKCEKLLISTNAEQLKKQAAEKQ